MPVSLITYESVPDYDDWGPDTYWNCMQWENWFYALKTHFGTNIAKEVWSQAWDQQSMGSSALDCRSFDSDFRAFLKKQDLESAAGTNILGTGYDIIKAGQQTVTATANVLKWAIPVIVVVLSLAVLYMIAMAAKTGKIPIKLPVK